MTPLTESRKVSVFRIGSGGVELPEGEEDNPLDLNCFVLFWWLVGILKTRKPVCLVNRFSRLTEGDTRALLTCPACTFALELTRHIISVPSF